MRISLIGGVTSSYITLKKLIEYGFDIVCVYGFTPSDTKLVSGYKDLQPLCKTNNIPFVPFTKINEHKDNIIKNKIDILFAVGISQLISSEIIDSVRIGCIGFHPTLLPEGRGRAPIAWLLIENNKGAATFFQINDKADAGPIFIQKPFNVSHNDNALTIQQKILKSLSSALDDWLPKLKLGKWDPKPQDDTFATEYGVRKPEDGVINWNNDLKEILDLIRVLTKPLPGAMTFIGCRKVMIYEAHPETDLKIKGVVGRVLKTHGNSFLIQCGNGLLWITDYEVDDISIKVGQKLGYSSEYEIYLIKNELRQLKKVLLK